MIFLLSFFLLTFIAFRTWFAQGVLSAGDWPFLFPEAIKEFFWPFAGRSYPPLDFFFQATAKILNNLGFSWILIERLAWFWPFLILTFFSSWFLAKTLFPKDKLIQRLTPFIYLFNTYILMLVGGGQMGVAMGYALAPLVFALFEKKAKLMAGLILALQMMFDPRLAFLTMGALVGYLIFNFGWKSLKTIIVPSLIAFGLHAFWLIPFFFNQDRAPLLPEGYGTSGWVEFLSFADFSNSISLLHPNWPENIFGKVYFMKPEFIILPIFAFVSLLFISGLKNLRIKKNVLFFNFLALVGAFLAKGVKLSFGEVYLWLFEHFPGMKMFRDPTKFYTLVVLSYSILIPFSVSRAYQSLWKKWKLAGRVFLLLVVICLLLLIQPVWRGQLSGTFKAKEVPQEYLVLKDFIYQQPEIFTTFWLPQKQRFTFSSRTHPALESQELASKKEMLTWQVKYVVIPFDSEEEIFLEDRKYSPEKRSALEKELDQIDWLEKVDLFKEISVYAVKPGETDL